VSLQICKDTARKREGQCLSTKYISSTAHMIWKCAKGHEWKASWSSIQSKHWCPDCGKTKKKTIDDCMQAASKRGGKCLSRRYKNIMSPMAWECQHGHRWKTPLNNIRSGTWCPVCAGKPNSATPTTKHS
jgi:hypothetical protein